MAAQDPESITKKKKSSKLLKQIVGLTVGLLTFVIGGVAVDLILKNMESAAEANPCDTHSGLSRVKAIAVTADSHRSPQAPLDYEADNLNDNDPTTVWIEGDTSGYGEGQQLRFTLPEGTDLQLICIVNGFARSEAQYAKNSRVEQLRVETERGTRVSVLPDKPNAEFAAREPLDIAKGKTSQVTMILEEARAASGTDAAKDMSVSDVLFWARP